jgi:hypothetical protein
VVTVECRPLSGVLLSKLKQSAQPCAHHEPAQTAGNVLRGVHLRYYHPRGRLPTWRSREQSVEFRYVHRVVRRKVKVAAKARVVADRKARHLIRFSHDELGHSEECLEVQLVTDRPRRRDRRRRWRRWGGGGGGGAPPPDGSVRNAPAARSAPTTPVEIAIAVAVSSSAITILPSCESMFTKPHIGRRLVQGIGLPSAGGTGDRRVVRRRSFDPWPGRVGAPTTRRGPRPGEGRRPRFHPPGASSRLDLGRPRPLVGTHGRGERPVDRLRPLAALGVGHLRNLLRRARHVEVGPRFR